MICGYVGCANHYGVGPSLARGSIRACGRPELVLTSGGKQNKSRADCKPEVVWSSTLVSRRIDNVV